MTHFDRVDTCIKGSGSFSLRLSGVRAISRASCSQGYGRFRRVNIQRPRKSTCVSGARQGFRTSRPGGPHAVESMAPCLFQTILATGILICSSSVAWSQSESPRQADETIDVKSLATSVRLLQAQVQTLNEEMDQV